MQEKYVAKRDANAAQNIAKQYSIIISSTLNLYEHQSTINPNMPIRGLLYFARMYENYIKENKLDVYGEKLLKLPAPRYIIFYNGRDNEPDKKLMCLSDAYEHSSEEEKVLECKALQLNINYGHNNELLKACKRLHDYSYFIHQVNQRLDKRMSLKQAIWEAMDYCIEHDILSDILSKQRNEVFAMLLTEYDEKKHIKMIRKDEREEGRREGKIEGKIEGRREGADILIEVVTQLREGVSEETLKEKGYTEDMIEKGKKIM